MTTNITSVSQNYTGRTVDINIGGSKNPRIPNLAPVTLTFGKTSSYVTGVQKLVQRYIVTLLTQLGSQQNTTDFGTTFVNILNGNPTAGDIEHRLVLANMKIITEFRQWQEATTLTIPLDEQLQTVVIDSITYEAGVLNLKLSISTLAGNTVEYILPLPDTA